MSFYITLAYVFLWIMCGGIIAILMPILSIIAISIIVAIIVIKIIGFLYKFFSSKHPGYDY